MGKIKIIGLFAIIFAIITVAGFLLSHTGENTNNALITGAVTGIKEETTSPVTTSSCDDKNICTVDNFNELTKTCEHTATDSCCGNGKCEDNERCDAVAQKTLCPKDCSLQCPANLIIHQPDDTAKTENSYVCGNDVNCEPLGDNEFRISEAEKAIITTMITNIGERSSKVISSKFYCGGDGLQIMYDDEVLGGVKFKDYFENSMQDEFESLNAEQSGDNSVAYVMEIDSSDRFSLTKEITCKIMIMSEDFTKSQVVKLKFD